MMGFRKLAALAGFSVILPMTHHAQANTFPDRPVRIIVGYAAGGTLDRPARILAQELSNISGQSFVVENRPGATSGIAMQTVARATPDGYTVLLTSPALSSIGALYKNLNYDPKKDFAHIGMFGALPTLVAARKDLPVDSMADLVALARKTPGKLNYGSPGTGSGAHLNGEILKRYADINMVHIPFSGAGPALAGLLGGHIDILIAGYSTLEPAVRSNEIKALAITNMAKNQLLPDVLPIGEVLPGYSAPPEYDFYTWLGLSVPSATPPEVVSRLESLLEKALSNPKLQQDLMNSGVAPAYKTGAEMKAQVEREIPAYQKVASDLKVNFD